MSKSRSKVSFGDHGLAGKLWVDLPHIIFVGEQSSGKTSVLERIVGKDFLPKGPRFVTRRPVEVELHKIDMGLEEYALFEGKRFVNFELVRNRIKQIFNSEQTGINIISSIPITLSIHSPYVFNSKLLDLPGLTNKVAGQCNIAQEVKNMIRTFITRPNCIILAIIPASDTKPSDVLELAREVDLYGVRTFTVFTKFDLVTTSFPLDFLTGMLYPKPKSKRLKCIYTAVVNRSQGEISAGKNILYADKNETRIFAGHSEIDALRRNLGIGKLKQALSKHLDTGYNRLFLPESFVNLTHTEIEAVLIRRIKPVDPDANVGDSKHTHFFRSSIEFADCYKPTDYISPTMVKYHANLDFELLENLPTINIATKNGSSYKKLQEVRHRNLQEIVEVISTNPTIENAQVMFQALSESLATNASHISNLTLDGMIANLDSSNFRSFLSGVLDPLVLLHKKGLFHGNIQLSSILVYTIGQHFVYQLGNYAYDDSAKEIKDIERRQVEDIRNVANIVEDIKDKTVDGVLYEVVDLCELLRSYFIGMNIKKEIFQRAAFVSHLDQPMYVLEACEFLMRKFGNGIQIHWSKVLLNQKWFEHVGSRTLKDLLIEKKAVVYNRKPVNVDQSAWEVDKNICQSGWSYIYAVRGCIRHYKENAYILSKSQIHEERMATVYSVFRYFRSYQPKFFVGLVNHARDAGFVFYSRNQIIDSQDFSAV